MFFICLLPLLVNKLFSQVKYLEDSINKITALLDTSKFSRVVVERNVFKEFPDPRKNEFRTGKYVASYYADSLKELKMVVSITEYYHSMEKLIVTYFFNEVSMINTDFLENRPELQQLFLMNTTLCKGHLCQNLKTSC